MFAVSDMKCVELLALSEVEAKEDAGQRHQTQQCTGGNHDQCRSWARSGDGPADAEQRSTFEVVVFRQRTGQAEGATEWCVESPSLQEPQGRGRYGNGRGHQQEHVWFVQAEHGVNGVVFVELRAGQKTPKEGAEQQTNGVEFGVLAHSAPPVTTRRTKVVTMAVIMNVTVTATLAGERCAVPHSP